MAILKSVTITVETGDGMHISLYATSSEGNPRFMNHELRKAITAIQSDLELMLAVKYGEQA